MIAVPQQYSQGPSNLSVGLYPKFKSIAHGFCAILNSKMSKAAMQQTFYTANQKRSISLLKGLWVCPGSKLSVRVSSHAKPPFTFPPKVDVALLFLVANSIVST